MHSKWLENKFILNNLLEKSFTYIITSCSILFLGLNLQCLEALYLILFSVPEFSFQFYLPAFS